MPEVVKAAGISVHCAHDKLVLVEELLPNPRNPNIHTAEQIRLLAKVINASGWRAPITVSTRSGLIVRGHARREAALFLGVDTAPVDYQDYETDEMELADLVADNKLAELAAMGIEETRAILEDLKRTDLDLELTGFNEIDMQRIFPEDDPNVPDKLPPSDVSGDFKENIRVVLVFKTNEEREEFGRRLGIVLYEGQVVYEWSKIIESELEPAGE